jgi:DNA repair photolyase
MKITEIKAKGILNPVRQPDDWFGLKYNMNLYRGCQHRCIYCDSRSECYQIADFDGEVLVKRNAVALLAEALQRKRIRGTIGTGSMNDPYMPVEKQFNLTGQALRVIAEYHFPVHVLTKSDLVLRDLDTLVEINQVYAAVSFTITTPDDALGKQIEPGAPAVSRRLAAMEKLAAAGILTGVLLMPVLPMVADKPEDLVRLLELAAGHGAAYVLPSLGMTLRDRQREYYYRQLDRHFPGLSGDYRRKFGGVHFAQSDNADSLYDLLRDTADRVGLKLKMPIFTPEKIEKQDPQIKLF